MSPTQEHKPPIPTGAGAKKAMEAYFAGTNHMEFRQRSSSSSRSTRTFSRGATPSRDAGANARSGASAGVPEGAIDPDALKNALKKIPSVEKINIRPTPPRSRSISRSHSPLPDEELLDETLPDFYKVTLKPTERTGSQTRDILLGGNRLSRGATPTGNGGDVPEFRRVALRRTPSREQLTDEQVHKRSTLKKNTVMEASTTSSSMTNLSRSSSFTSLTAINKTVLSRKNSTAEEDKPEFKGFVLKKTGSRPGSRAGSPTKLSGSRTELHEGASSLKKVETAASSRSASRRNSAASESAEFANVTLKKAQVVKGDQSKFQVEQVSLKPIPVGEVEEDAKASSSSEGQQEQTERRSLSFKRRDRSSSASRQRVQRETKFEANDEEYHDIKSSLDKLKKREATPVRAEAALKDAAPKDDDAAAKPIVYRRKKLVAPEDEEAEKVHLKPVVRKSLEKEDDDSEKVQLKKPVEKRLSFVSSIECIKKAVEEEEEQETKRAPLMRKMSFTSSLDNIAIASDEKEKVHLSCFSREMGSNVDLVQVCQDQGQGKHEVKLEFEIEGNQAKTEAKTEAEVEAETKAEAKVEIKAEIKTEVEVKAETKEDVTAKIESSCQEAKEAIEQRLTAEIAVDDETGERTSKQEEEEEEEEEEEIREEVVTLHKIRKAPSIDGLFQRQDVQAAFTFTLPFQNEQPTTKLALEIPNLS